MGMPGGNYFLGPELTISGLTSYHQGGEPGPNHSNWPKFLPLYLNAMFPLQQMLHGFLLLLMLTFVSKNIISCVGCVTQLTFFLFIIISKYYVLTIMASDCFVAIYNP